MLGDILLNTFGLGNVRTNSVEYIKQQVRDSEQKLREYQLPLTNEIIGVGKSYLPVELDISSSSSPNYSNRNQNLADYSNTNWGQSYLGTPVFSPFAFEDGNYTKGNELIKYAGIRLDTALIDVSLEKHIVRTLIQGRNGTVKEYVSDGDYVISVKALLVSPNASLSPESAMRKLINLFSVPDSLPIKSDFLQLFSIYRIVVDKPSFKQVQGFNNMIAVEFSAYSDEDLASVTNKELDRPKGV